ncbi:hypothetical protein [Nannocystis punicea]|uniref:Uncharacterized protein n=1 Tax=Nannocystis punicea TaxID=2995304 RepID=A0ABY7GXN5_9BACT|nr:hypothetical protein [Nannocystis poenicansa]WAS91731.1 hypothetical protein O0S08_36580 [Nannocystis poenicansa]
MQRFVKLVASFSVLVGCTVDWDAVAQAGKDLPSLSSSSGAVTSGATTDATSMTAPASTAGSSMTSGAAPGSGSEGDSASAAGDEGGEAEPLEVEVFLTPSSVHEVGEVQIGVWTSRPVTAIDIFDGDAPLVLGAAPKEPVAVLEVTSDDAPGDGLHTIRAVGHTADNVSAEDEEDLLVDVAPGGTDVWPPYVHDGPLSGFTGVALLDDYSIAASGFLETEEEGLVAVVVKLDSATSSVEAGPISLGKVSLAGAGIGPAIAASEDGAVYVASTRAGSTWAVSKVRPGEPLPLVWTATGDPKTKAFGIAFAGDRVVVVGASEVAPGTHDLKVWWVSAADGKLFEQATFAASLQDDPKNGLDELGRGVAVVEDELVVVGERQIYDELNQKIRRAVVLRYGLDGELLDEWTSAGELLEEDGAMAVAPLRDGGFVVTGWGRDVLTIRQVLTRWFSATGEAGAVRFEPTPGSDAIAYAVGEDREGKIVLAGSRKGLVTDQDAWIFAIPGPLGVHAWDVVRSGPGKGPDDAADLAIGPWGHVSVVGSEFAELQPRAYALRLYP